LSIDHSPFQVTGAGTGAGSAAKCGECVSRWSGVAAVGYAVAQTVPFFVFQPLTRFCRSITHLFKLQERARAREVRQSVENAFPAGRG
jgi:hypothetical protein